MAPTRYQKMLNRILEEKRMNLIKSCNKSILKCHTLCDAMMLAVYLSSSGVVECFSLSMLNSLDHVKVNFSHFFAIKQFEILCKYWPLFHCRAEWF